MEQRVFRKSWINYIGPVVRGLIFLGLLLWLLLNFGRAVQWTNGFVFDGLAQYDRWFVLAAALLLLWWVIRSVFHFIWLRTWRVHIGPGGVSASHGIFPWNKWERHWEPHQIFNCLYRGRGFFNWILRQGDLIVQGTEGATHQFVFTRLAGVRQACAMVNDMRARPVNAAPVTPTGGMAEG